MRKAKLLLAAFSEAPFEGQAFSWREVGVEALFDESESYDLAFLLAKDGFLRMEGDSAYLTPEGREVARVLKASSRPPTTLSETECQFLLAATESAEPGGEIYGSVIAKKIGAPFQPLRTRLLALGMLRAGQTFGSETLTAYGIEAVRQIRIQKARQQAGGTNGIQR